MKTPRLNRNSLALITGALIPIALAGGYIGYSSGGAPTTPDIPSDPGTMMNVINTIIGSNANTVKDTQAVDGYDKSLFVYHSGAISDTLIMCQYDAGVGGTKKVLTGIRIDATGKAQPQCANIRGDQQIPILATIRDLDDSSCNSQVSYSGSKAGRSGFASTSIATDVKEGDTIKTGSCPLTSLYFVDHSVLRLGSGTTLTLSTAGSDTGGGTADVTLTTGELWARVLKPRIDGSYFEIGTSDGAVGVRGTSVWVRKDTSGTIALSIDSGKTEVINGSGAMIITGTGRYALDRVDVGLKRKITISSTSGLGTAGSTLAEKQIYYDDGLSKSLIRAATLRDIADYRALQDGVGNLRTISMTGGWLNGKNIYSGSVVAAATGISYTDPNKAFVITEFNQTIPASSATEEKNYLCKSILGDSLDSTIASLTSAAGGTSSNAAFWSQVPRGTSSCKPNTIQWMADYRAGDTKMYSSGGVTKDKLAASSFTTTNDGIKIDANNQYISYSTTDINPSSLKGKTIEIKLKDIPDDIGKKYIFDFGNIWALKDGSDYKCRYEDGSDADGDPIIKLCPLINFNNRTVTITLPQITPLKIIFGNNSLNTQLPIKNTIQSIYIKNS